MPDICDLILDEHEAFRRCFAQLDQHRSNAQGAKERLGELWEPLATGLDRHAAAEEETFYPSLVRWGKGGDEETTDAIKDHNEIRDAVAESRRHEVASDGWWKAVGRARDQNSDHMAEEEREGLADFRANVAQERRQELGEHFEAFNQAHAAGRDVDTGDKDPEAYVTRQHH